MSKKTKSSGGKLSRSEIIQARLSPRLRYAAEIMSRNERRTLSSIIEMLIEDALLYYHVELRDPEPHNVSLDDEMEFLWDTDDGARFVKLCLELPYLLTAEEEKLWNRIQEIKYFWHCRKRIYRDEQNKIIRQTWEPIFDDECLLKNNLREYWQELEDDLYSERLNAIQEQCGVKCHGEVIDDKDADDFEFEDFLVDKDGHELSAEEIREIHQSYATILESENQKRMIEEMQDLAQKQKFLRNRNLKGFKNRNLISDEDLLEKIIRGLRSLKEMEESE